MTLFAGASEERAEYYQNLRFKWISVPGVEDIGGQWETVQDQDGFLWFGGAGGVARFDGYEFRHFKHDPDSPTSLNNNYVTDIVIDAQQRMWVSALGGLHLYNPQEESFERILNTNSGLSHNWIWDIDLDHEGKLWLATDGGGLSVLEPDTREFQHYRNQTGDPTSLPSDATVSVLWDEHGYVWVGTKDRGLARLNLATQRFDLLPTINADPGGLSSANVLTLFKDSHNTLWVGTHHGLNRLNNDGSFTHFLHDPSDPWSISGNTIRDIKEDESGFLWVAVDGGGLNILDKTTSRFHRHQKIPLSNEGIFNNALRSIFKDRQGGYWFGHYPYGITKLDEYASAFQIYRHHPFESNSLSHSDVLSLDEDAKGNLWVGTEGGLNYINRQNGRIQRFAHQPENNESLSANPVLSVLYDSHGELWVGTWGGGLNRLVDMNGKFKRYQHSTTTAISYTPGAQEVGNLEAFQIRSMLQDSRGELWFGHEFGLSRYVRESDSFQHFMHDPKNDRSILELGVNTLFEDSQQRLWLGMDSGLARYDASSKSFIRYRYDTDNPKSIASGYVSAIAEDKHGNLWLAVGSQGISVLDIEKGTFKHLNSDNGLVENRVGALVAGPTGSMWIASAHGLSAYRDGKVERHFRKKHGMAGEFYKRPAALITSAGELAFGSSEGLSIFKPEKIPENKYQPPVWITDLSVLNQPVKHNDASKILNSPVERSSRIELNYKQSVLDFRFAALNYILPENNSYQYWLEGFDQTWVDAGTSREATYTNLDAGEYQFRVRAANNEGVWSEHEAQLVVKVRPAPWMSTWAFTLYGLMFLTALIGFISSQRRKVRENYQREKLQLLEGHLNELEEMSYTDPLTGLNNRRYLHNRIDNDVALCLQNHRARLENQTLDTKPQDLIFIVIDIDHFKRINDRFGHSAGDTVLATVGKVIKRCFRESDYCIRWGGEEFVVVVRHCLRDQAPTFAEKLRREIGNTKIEFQSKAPMSISCSLGFACYPLQRSHPERHTWDTVLELADSCLYAAKLSGRDAWLGLSADDNTAEDFDRRWLSDPASCINEKGVALMSSIESIDAIRWKKM